MGEFELPHIKLCSHRCYVPRRRTLLPLISLRWKELLHSGGPVWAETYFDVNQEFPGESVPNCGAVLAWFGRNVGSINVLSFYGDVQRLPASLLSAALMSQAGSLTMLSIDMDTVIMSAADIAMLAPLRRLEILDINLPVAPDSLCWDDSAANLINTVSKLPALKFVGLSGRDGIHDESQATVSLLAVLTSSTLTSINFRMSSNSEGTLLLGTLPALLSCCLFGCSILRDITLDVHSLHGAPHLTELDLSIENVRLTECCFGRSCELVDLTLSCNLYTVPQALCGLKKTLKSLDLSYNRALEMDQAGFDTLLSLQVLTNLTLMKSPHFDNVRELGAWSPISKSFLSMLSAELHFCKPRC